MLCKSYYRILHNVTYSGVSTTEEHAQQENPQQRSTDHTKYRQGGLWEEFSQIKHDKYHTAKGAVYAIVNTTQCTKIGVLSSSFRLLDIQKAVSGVSRTEKFRPVGL